MHPMLWAMMMSRFGNSVNSEGPEMSGMFGPQVDTVILRRSDYDKMKENEKLASDAAFARALITVFGNRLFEELAVLRSQLISAWWSRETAPGNPNEDPWPFRLKMTMAAKDDVLLELFDNADQRSAVATCRLCEFRQDAKDARYPGLSTVLDAKSCGQPFVVASTVTLLRSDYKMGSVLGESKQPQILPITNIDGISNLCIQHLTAVYMLRMGDKVEEERVKAVEKVKRAEDALARAKNGVVGSKPPRRRSR